MYSNVKKTVHIKVFYEYILNSRLLVHCLAVKLINKWNDGSGVQISSIAYKNVSRHLFNLFMFNRFL